MGDTSVTERREQLRHLNDSLVSGSLSRQEYDELLPFVASQPQPQRRQEDAAFAAALAQAQQPSDPPASADRHSSSPQRRSVHFAADAGPPAPEPIEAPPQYQILAPVAAANVGAGLQLRCPACGTSNDTARGPRCYVCSSKLTVADELSAAIAARSSYGGRGTSSRASRWPVVTAVAPPSGAFSAAEDGRVLLLGGYFSCAMEATQLIATADGSACQVFVMCCTLQPRDGDQQHLLATWYVSQRFSQFERLHKALKRRLARSTAASLPPFPAKYHLTDRLEKRKQGLAAYMPRLLEMCAHLPNAQPAPELDEFLDASHQIQLFRSQRPAPPVVSASPPVDGSQRSAASTSTAATSVSSPFPAFTGPAMVPSQPAAPPMDETELAQAEGAVRLLTQAVRNARGDVRDDGTVQHHLDMCVQLAPALQRSADLDNPFADSELIPRAMQCQEDLQQAVALYNDALLAVSGLAPIQQQVQHAQHVQQSEPHVQAQMSVRNVVPASAA
ncbi:hypothetical protein PF005_g18156 [Phytophthora fragariae]|uniref:PX domain-containing protein n=1 Tax=Phytophthora fragariae TaxID=53985 RepID=A0A6A3KXC3_9STRA|nr:hypothetical protein PF003_g74 [Phytophthora fragariae]KAE8930695.1 hypothetical protein PF009_g19221 [Phytophthora fragariae]KAE9008174.1 hypothetical protein PF011_g10803 [Phytophthora fragariae]KAE9093141.1 hypothetical protein PF010_g17605 [Phytophthora fragariae]KAE9119604.1 hypothetical protein PF007_g8476 [Phytophthora fragariae]